MATSTTVFSIDPIMLRFFPHLLYSLLKVKATSRQSRGSLFSNHHAYQDQDLMWNWGFGKRGRC